MNCQVQICRQHVRNATSYCSALIGHVWTFSCVWLSIKYAIVVRSVKIKENCYTAIIRCKYIQMCNLFGCTRQGQVSSCSCYGRSECNGKRCCLPPASPIVCLNRASALEPTSSQAATTKIVIPFPEESENVTRWIVDQNFRKEQERLKIPLGEHIEKWLRRFAPPLPGIWMWSHTCTIHVYCMNRQLRYFAQYPSYSAAAEHTTVN